MDRQFSGAFDVDVAISAIDYDDSTWRRVKKLAEHRIEEERAVLETPISQERTQECRGAIRAWRYVLSWPDRAQELRDRVPRENS